MTPWINEKKVEIFGKYCEIHVTSENGYYDENKKDILMISHTMERGGAPLVLLELAKKYQNIYNVWIVTLFDGNLKEQFIRYNMPVAVCSPLQLKNVFDDIGWNSFEMVWVNTLVSYQYLMLFQNTSIPVYWWIHEPEQLFCAMYNSLPDFRILSSNINVLPVSRLVSRYIKKYYQLDCNIIHIPIDNLNDKVNLENACDNCRKEKVTFFMPAKFQAVKAQDVLANAILKMPESYRKKSFFLFAGAKDAQQPEYYELMKQLEGMFPHTISVLGELEREQIFEIYLKIDCVLAPSRMDSLNATIIEAMMFKKVCISSDSTGISMYMKDGENGFIVKTEDADDLARKIMYVIDNIDDLQKIRENGYNTYLDNFETSKVWKKVLEITQK